MVVKQNKIPFLCYLGFLSLQPVPFLVPGWSPNQASTFLGAGMVAEQKNSFCVVQASQAPKNTILGAGMVAKQKKVFFGVCQAAQAQKR